MRTDLHLVSWNRPAMTELVIRTIKANTDPENYRLVVMDNNSDSQRYLERLHNNGFIDELYLFETNLGLEWARSFLLRDATYSDRFICVDNDCLPPKRKGKKDWVTRLNDLMDKHPDYAAIAARTQVMIGTGNIFEEADKNKDDLVDFPWPGGSLRIMNTAAVKSVGGWDRIAPGRGQEEKYICGKLHERGYRTAFATNIHTHHLFGTRGDNPTDRWGYKADMEPADSGHSDIWHPVLGEGDVKEDLLKYATKEDVRRYYAHRHYKKD